MRSWRRRGSRIVFSGRRLNNALTIFYCATPLGSALGYLLGGFALTHGGWRNGFLWAGAPGLLLALALLTLTEPARATAGQGDAVSASAASVPKPGLGGYGALFRIGDFNLILIGLTAYTFAIGAFAAWGPTFLNRVHGLDLPVADQFFGGVLVAAGLLGTLVGGFAATVWRRKSPSGYALLLTLSAAMTVLAATGSFLSASAHVSMACLAAAMFLAFLPTGPTNTLLLESVPVSLRASSMAASLFVIHLFGDFWSPVIVGDLADWGFKPEEPGAGLQHAMLILPAVLCLSVLSWGWLALRTTAPDRNPAAKRLPDDI